MAKMKSAQEVVAKALWAEGNNRIGHRPWEQVGNTYMAEAGKALAALRASGFTVAVLDLVTDNDVLMDLVNDGTDLYIVVQEG